VKIGVSPKKETKNLSLLKTREMQSMMFIINVALDAEVDLLMMIGSIMERFH
jgi:hypothetical protein